MPRLRHSVGGERWLAPGLLLLALGGVIVAVVGLIRRLSGAPDQWQIDMGAFGLLLLLIISLLAAAWFAYRSSPR